MRLRLWAWRIAVLVPLCLSFGSLLALMRDTPLAQPLVNRGTAAVQAELDRMLAWRMTPEWVRAEIEAALAAEDLDRVRSLAVLAAQRGMAPSADLMQQMQALEDAKTGLLA